MPILDNVTRPAIWGFGREGHAVLADLRANHPELKPTLLNDTALDDSQGAPSFCGAEALDRLTAGAFDLVIKSPGISRYRPEIAAAKAAGTRFTTATNLWFERNAGAKILAVTGTKGKSSTARLLHHLLCRAGLDARIYGNVGIPMLGEPAGRDATVLELSSYQIADLAFAPTLAVITNLYPEHAPWHGGAEQYFRDKLRLIDIAPGTPAIVNFANDRLRARLKDHAGLIWFNREDGFAAEGESVRFQNRPVACAGFSLKGEHNYANLAAALAAADAFGVPDLRTQADLSGFRQLAHRLEEFTAGGITCVNDSLSTVPQAAEAALKTYAGRRIALILGGTDRGQNYAALADLLPRENLACVFLLPVTGSRIKAELDRAPRPFDYIEVPDLETAVAEGFRRLTPGDVFLMSPAAPSFGQFKNYADRGDRFKTLCQSHDR